MDEQLQQLACLRLKLQLFDVCSHVFPIDDRPSVTGTDNSERAIDLPQASAVTPTFSTAAGPWPETDRPGTSESGRARCGPLRSAANCFGARLCRFRDGLLRFRDNTPCVNLALSFVTACRGKPNATEEAPDGAAVGVVLTS